MRVDCHERSIHFRHLPQDGIADRDHHRFRVRLVDLVAVRVQFRFCRRGSFFRIQHFALQLGQDHIADLQAALALGWLVGSSPLDFLGRQRNGRAIGQQEFSPLRSDPGDQGRFPCAIPTGQFHTVQLFENVV